MGKSDTVQIIIKGDAAAIQSRDDYNPYAIWSVQLERFLNYQKIKKLIIAIYIPRAWALLLRDVI